MKMHNSIAKEVFLYNANTAPFMVGQVPDPQTGENTDGTYAISSPNDFCYLSSGVITSYNESSPTPYTFYTFPNTDATTPTKIVIKGALLRRAKIQFSFTIQSL